MDLNMSLRTDRYILWAKRHQIRLDDLGDYLCFCGSWIRCKIVQDVNGGGVRIFLVHKFPHQSHHQ